RSARHVRTARCLVDGYESVEVLTSQDVRSFVAARMARATNFLTDGQFAAAVMADSREHPLSAGHSSLTKMTVQFSGSKKSDMNIIEHTIK
ncbi:hypothetical protein, partial [Heliophilum fasciatum]|uniref:hypothetical protein n=1 Tax=Heliophilum fasciatum TaxID=35700 RepID=UPI001A9B7200